ncbi:MAG: hypothetical protein MJA30_36165, partial [Cytophagales bacterium]|nr:hypothetical protein [Cytophagales bacterium]
MRSPLKMTLPSNPPSGPIARNQMTSSSGHLIGRSTIPVQHGQASLATPSVVQFVTASQVQTSQTPSFSVNNLTESNVNTN